MIFPPKKNVKSQLIVLEYFSLMVLKMRPLIKVKGG